MAIRGDQIEGSETGSQRANGVEPARVSQVRWADPGDPSRRDPHRADSSELVHEARKAIKRMRALARLLRHELGEPEFKRVNSSLRDAGRRLAGTRDAQVRLATLTSLTDRHSKALAREGIGLLSARLERERAQSDEPSDNAEVLEDIAAMRRQLARWNLADRDFEDLAPGLRRIYREGRHRHARVECEHARDAQDLHDWRKRVKSLYYALDTLGGKRAKGARKATRRADRLGDLLGEEHDLWMLRIYVEEHPDAFGADTAARDELLDRIERGRRRLRARALRLGARLYRHGPGKFTRRLGAVFSR
jgi:CHAD domain-containing protein